MQAYFKTSEVNSNPMECLVKLMHKLEELGQRHILSFAQIYSFRVNFLILFPIPKHMYMYYKNNNILNQQF